MSTASAIPHTTPDPNAITTTAVKTLTNLPSHFQHAMPSSTQQALTKVAKVQVQHKDSIVGGEKVHVSVVTPGGKGEDLGNLTHTGSAADSVTVSTLMVNTMGAGLSDKAIRTFSPAGENVWFGKTDHRKTSSENWSSVPSASSILGNEKTAPVAPSFLYAMEMDFQSDPADFSPQVGQYPLADSKHESRAERPKQI